MARLILRCKVGCPELKSSYREKGLFSEYRFLLIGFHYIQKLCLSTLNNFIVWALPLYFVLTNVLCLLFALNSYFLPLYISFCYLSQAICSKWVSCSKSRHPKNLLQNISKHLKENHHYRVQLLLTTQPKLNLLKLRSTTEVFCKCSEVSSATSNQNTFYWLLVKFLWRFSVAFFNLALEMSECNLHKFTGYCHKMSINFLFVTDNWLGVSQRLSEWATYTETVSVCSYKIHCLLSLSNSKNWTNVFEFIYYYP